MISKEQWSLVSDWMLTGGGIIASVLLALNNEYSKWAYVFFIISSLGGIYVGRYHKVTSVLVLQLFYLVVDCYAVTQWFFR